GLVEGGRRADEDHGPQVGVGHVAAPEEVRPGADDLDLLADGGAGRRPCLRFPSVFMSHLVLRPRSREGGQRSPDPSLRLWTGKAATKAGGYVTWSEISGG